MAPKRSNRKITRKSVKLTAITTPTYPPYILLDLPTELLVKILTYLPVVDLFSVRWICRTLRDVIAGTAYLQYIIHAHINGVEDSLPPDFPYSERLELLRRHQQTWSAPQFNLFTKCVTNMSYGYHFILQDGYLIYESLWADPQQYGYTDLYSTARNEEVCWVHITIDNSRVPPLNNVIFAIDHDLVVGLRFVSLTIPLWVQNLTKVLAYSDLETMMLSRYSSPSSNSRLVYFILSHQLILCRFHKFMGTAILLWAQKSWEITSWFHYGNIATTLPSTSWSHGRQEP